MLRILRRLTLSAVPMKKDCIRNVRHYNSNQKILSKFCSIEIIHKQFYSTVIISPSSEECNDEPNIAEIIGENKELEHKLKVLILEADVLRQEGKGIPSNAFLKPDHWRELLRLPSKSGRRKYLEYLFKLEKKKENRLKKKEEKRAAWDESQKPIRDSADAHNYELGGNNILLRIYETTMNQMYNNRLIQAMQFGQKLVVDCGFYNEMTTRENTNCAKQLMLLFAENRMNDEPFDLHYCNISKESELMKRLHKSIRTMYEPWFPLNLHEKSYLDLVPKDKLVYLTPHCRDVLKEFSHDDVYILGAIVDKVNNEPLSLAKAKKEGIRMAKLPLDYYLEWGSGSGKSLTINQVTSILLDIKNTGDWKYALRHVPRRKLMEFFSGKTDNNLPNKFNRYNQNSVTSRLKYNYNKSTTESILNNRIPSRYNRKY
ncbi:hypothetical protein RN001_012215 [Aquatica leii]|uniref:RNA (guanine-9-)-methyltransferase domain-containing protein 1 n=1 Tax=Aquatica leii TaxID=1421715 RepID=A0AAN7QEN4_9COLE|nr:hypothetical protein RN001_012215 [Aquatica leii]